MVVILARLKFEWLEWGDSVRQDAAQVAQAVEANAAVYVQLASKPPVQRGLMAYARYCYRTPREII